MTAASRRRNDTTDSAGAASASLVERVRRANLPPPPEHSVLFRVVTTVAVVTGIVSCEAVGELSAVAALTASVAVALGMFLSYATRRRPRQWLKLLLAATVIVIFGEFVRQILSAAHTGQLASIEVPLAGLFTWVQVVHAFDVPARRDLLFSLAAAAALVTVASAQAVSSDFLLFVAVLLVAGVVGLGCSWRSMSADSRALPVPTLGLCLAAVIAVALGLVVVLPAPRASQALTLPASLTSYLPLAGAGIVNGTGPHPNEPAQPGAPGGKIGVGGYVGFAGPLDIADRASLGTEVIMRVRADRPGYFLGMTYDIWNGQSWLQSRHDRGATRLTGGSPFQIPTPALAGQHVTDNVQTFYVEKPLPNLLFATSEPTAVYFPANSLILGHDGSLRSTVAVTPGTVYTVVSADDEVPASLLAADRRPLTARVRAFPEIKAALQLPYGYPRVAALARRIVNKDRARTTEAKVQALEGWIASHTEYSTAIPPLAAGQDAVTEFLFGNRKGYCEQISTALAIMLRTLGVPAREAIGYVPGPYDPLSNLYNIQAKDAHAWVQVYFPHYGWQNFDPTAQVPLAPESPGSVLVHDAWQKLVRLPLAPVGSLAGAGIAGYGVVSWERRRRRRPATWAGKMALRLERLGARAGLDRSPAETLTDYAGRIDQIEPSMGLSNAAAILERTAYGPPRPAEDQKEVLGPTESAEVARALSALARRAARLRFSRARRAPR
ncbi:MAG: transglutaminase TgpA family protein [Acidimicrobiales bacterium]